jgi:hypothetical protein
LPDSDERDDRLAAREVGERKPDRCDLRADAAESPAATTEPRSRASPDADDAGSD